MAQSLARRATRPVERPSASLALPADAVRALVVASVVVGAWYAGPIGAALFLLVAGGSLVPRVVGVPATLDTLYCGTLLFAAWAAVLDWYVAVSWLDVVVHATATGLVAVVAVAALERWGALTHPGTRLERVVVTVGLGGTLAVLWELGEWAGHTFLDPAIQVGYQDTIGDLAAGLAGTVVVAVALGRRR